MPQRAGGYNNKFLHYTNSKDAESGDKNKNLVNNNNQNKNLVNNDNQNKDLANNNNQNIDIKKELN